MKVINKCQTRWDTGLSIAGPNNDVVVGRWYMTNTVGWFDLLAISGIWIDLPGKEIMIAPNLPPRWARSSRASRSSPSG